MIKLFIGFILLNAVFSVSSGQTYPDTLTSECNADNRGNGIFLKDFRIKLGEGIPGEELRFKTTMSLRGRTTYRFSMCTDKISKGHLIINIRNDQNKTVASSFDGETGGVYPYIDFHCKKSGIYLIYYDFTESRSGSGVSIVSTIE
ncbi:MAG: hypothetical protein WCE64_13840 [Bacteroidales bacterium]